MHRVVPELIVENYRQGKMSGDFAAVGMFLDLSGFSKMTDTLMQHGQHGAEVLAGLMHGVFDPLVRSIFGYGGKIVSFAGDGIMALYPVQDGEKSTALRALASAWGIQQQLDGRTERITVYGNFAFSVKIGLTLGSVSWRILRSDDGMQAAYYFRGSAVEEAAHAEHQAKAGDILLTHAMHESLEGLIQSQPYGSFHRLLGFRAALPESQSYTLPAVDHAISRLFMPEDVIIHDMRGEFRQITNLFMRMPDLPDEKLAGFLDTIFALRRQYGGLLTRLDFGDKGCNLLMLWGAPVAYENDITRALNFVLDLQMKVDFPITAGLTYYIAHAGYLGGEMCEDYTCYGWGVNLASRFMMNAPDGEIWVDERVARRVSQKYEIEYIGSQSFKGFSAEQAVNVLRSRKNQMDAIYQGEMVGRTAELMRLREFLEPVWQGDFAGVIAVTGDAGIGKGRLIHALATSDLIRDHKALWWQCQADQILRQSFNPLLGWLSRYFGISPDQTLDEKRRAFDLNLDELLGSILDPELAQELTRTHSILGALVGVFWDGSLYSQLDAEGRYNNTFLALIALVKAVSLRQPLILFLDDFHFADQDTSRFLLQLKRSFTTSAVSYPAAVVLAFRRQGVDLNIDEELPDSEIRLDGVSHDDLSRLAEIILGGQASGELIELVRSHSEGNPYFAEQVIHYLQEEGLLEMSRNGWRQVKSGRAVLPNDIRALLVARLDQLAHEVKHVVQTASVLGREFEVRVLAQMLGPGTDTMNYVSEAEKAVIWLPLKELRYIFYHGLLRDAAYTMQMLARRRELHAVALDALETLYGNDLDRRYAELAHHAEQGGIQAKAQQYFSLAGRTSAELYQNPQAVDYLTRALVYTPFDDLAARFDLVVERVELFSRLGQRGLQLKDLDSLEQWAGQLKDVDRHAKVMMLRSAYHYFTGNYQESIEYAKKAVGTSALLADSNQVLYTQILWATSLLRLGYMEEAMQRAQSALEWARGVANQVEEARILNVMGWIALEQRESPPAKQYLVEALEISRRVKDLDIESKVLNNLAMAESTLNGNYALARRYYEQCYKIAQEIGDRPSVGTALANLGFAAGMQGDFTAARSYFEQALKIAREVGDLYSEIYTLINLSAMDVVQNQAESARQNAVKAADLASSSSERSGEAWAMLYLGHACLLQGDIEEAQAAYRKSLDIRQDLDQTSLSMEPIAGLVESYLQMDDLASAALQAEKILQFLGAGSTLDGADEPLRVYHTCYRFLEKTNDPRARQILQTAKALLEAQVSKFSDEADQKRYVENIPWRRAISEAG